MDQAEKSMTFLFGINSKTTTYSRGVQYTYLDVLSQIGGLFIALKLVGQVFMAIFVKLIGSTNIERYLIS